MGDQTIPADLLVRLMAEVSALAASAKRNTELLDKIDGKVDVLTSELAATKQARNDDSRRLGVLETKHLELEKKIEELDRNQTKHAVKLTAIVSGIAIAGSALVEPIRLLFRK